MKIGILTYHRSHNYGALLQAVALRLYLSSLGHETYYIDFWPEYHKDKYLIFIHSYIKNLTLLIMCRYIISTLLKILKIKKRQSSFNKFINKYIEPYCSLMTEEYDCIIYGSDQIWRKQSGLSDEFNPIYFGDNSIKRKKDCSYAASMGVMNLNVDDIKWIETRLTKFKKLSVREKDLQRLLLNIGLKNVEQVVDPTFLIDKQVWYNIFPIEDYSNKKYLLLYDLLEDSFDYKSVDRFAKDNGLEIIELKGSIKRKKIENSIVIYDADPVKMMELIKNATYVFTSSFHGLVFSIIFNRDFLVSFSHNSERARSLLNDIDLKDRLIKPKATEIPTLLPIDYSQVNNLLKNMIISSKCFLSSI